MSWYYYLEGKIRFPFQARCITAKPVSPLRAGEVVEVLRMAPEDACEHDMLVQIRWQRRRIAIPCLNWPPLIQTNQPTKPLAIGTTG